MCTLAASRVWPLQRNEETQRKKRSSVLERNKGEKPRPIVILIQLVGYPPSHRHEVDHEGALNEPNCGLGDNSINYGPVLII